MIKIIARDDFLSVSGHAGAAPKGQDIVCSAVSTLITGAAEIWKDRRDVVIKRNIQGDNTDFEFSFKLDILGDDVRQEYVFLRKYLDILFTAYPEYIDLSVS